LRGGGRDAVALFWFQERVKVEHARLFFAPKIWITAEHAADMLGISIEKADQLLSRPDTSEILKAAMHAGLQAALRTTLEQMARVPHEAVPTRVDVAVALPPLPTARTFAKE